MINLYCVRHLLEWLFSRVSPFVHGQRFSFLQRFPADLADEPSLLMDPHVRGEGGGVSHALATGLAVELAAVSVLHVGVGFQLAKEIKGFAAQLTGHVVLLA